MLRDSAKSRQQQSFRSLVLVAAQLLVASVSATTTFTPVVTATNWIGWANYVGSKLAYLDSDGFITWDKLAANTTVANFSDFACSQSKQTCLVVNDFIATAFTSDGATIKKNETYRVRDQSTLRLQAAIGIIENSDYFLVSSLSRYGLIRWKFGLTDKHGNVNFTGIGDSFDTYDLLVIPTSPFAIVSYSGYNNLMVANFVLMTDLRRIPINCGLLAPLTNDLSKGYMVNTVENGLVKLNYDEGTIKGNINTTPYLAAIKNVPGSDWVIVVSYRSLQVYDLSGDVFSAWSQKYFQTTTTSVSGIWLDQVVGSLISFGPGYVNAVSETSQTLCHPYCSSCTVWLSPNFCSACTGTNVLTGTTCAPPVSSITSPPGGAVVYSSASWSTENISPVPPAKGFNIMDYYIYFVIGGAALLGICFVYCFCKMCCCKDEEKQNRVHQSSKDFDD